MVVTNTMSAGLPVSGSHRSVFDLCIKPDCHVLNHDDIGVSDLIALLYLRGLWR